MRRRQRVGWWREQVLFDLVEYVEVAEEGHVTWSLLG